MKRLEFMFEKLDGKKTTAAVNGSTDEFTNLQLFISEAIVSLRNRIEKKRRDEQKGDNYVQVIKAKNEMKEQARELKAKVNELESLLNATRDSPKFTRQIKADRATIVEKLKEIVAQLTSAIDDDEVRMDQFRQPTAKLLDLQNDHRSNRLETNAEITDFGPDDPHDQQVLDEWQVRDRKLEEKLGDVVLVLDELRVMNRNFANEMAVRDQVVDYTSKDAFKVNKEIEEQNKSLAAVLRKYRAPGKFCMDICMIILLLGLISVIVMLAMNGKT
jgi:chromosome segregation ATPase